MLDLQIMIEWLVAVYTKIGSIEDKVDGLTYAQGVGLLSRRF